MSGPRRRRTGPTDRRTAALAVLLGLVAVAAGLTSPLWLLMLPLALITGYGARLGLSPAGVAEAVDRADSGDPGRGPAGLGL